MAYLRAKDTVNGALGTCYARIDGERHELMQVKNVTATVKKTRKRRLGRHRENDGVLRFQSVPQGNAGLYEKWS